jgi:hypothetical protein
MRSRDVLAAALDDAIDWMQRDPTDDAGELVFVDARTAELLHDLRTIEQTMVPRAEFRRTLEACLVGETGDGLIPC